MTSLFIKNMVCPRCIMAVETTLRRAGLHPQSVELGHATVADTLCPEQRDRLAAELAALGFELLSDRRQQLIEQIKAAVIRFIRPAPPTSGDALMHERQERGSTPAVNLSTYLSRVLHTDYDTLSRLFSEVTSITLEHYYILQRVERVKELISYDQLSLSQIADLLNYSSVAYLSSQFKQTTGMTPTLFKRLQCPHRRPLDRLGKTAPSDSVS